MVSNDEGSGTLVDGLAGGRMPAASAAAVRPVTPAIPATPSPALSRAPRALLGIAPFAPSRDHLARGDSRPVGSRAREAWALAQRSPRAGLDASGPPAADPGPSPGLSARCGRTFKEFRPRGARRLPSRTDRAFRPKSMKSSTWERPNSSSLRVQTMTATNTGSVTGSVGPAGAAGGIGWAGSGATTALRARAWCSTTRQDSSATAKEQATVRVVADQVERVEPGGEQVVPEVQRAGLLADQHHLLAEGAPR